MRKVIDNEALQAAIEQKRNNEDNRQILTRSEQKLERQMTEAADMQHTLKELDKDIEATKSNISNLTALLTKMEGNHKDLSADLRSTLQSIHQLQMDGVSL